MLRDRLNTSLTVSHQFYLLAQKYLTSKYLVNLPSRQLIVYWKKWQIGFCNIAIVWQSLSYLLFLLTRRTCNFLGRRNSSQPRFSTSSDEPIFQFPSPTQFFPLFSFFSLPFFSLPLSLSCGTTKADVPTFRFLLLRSRVVETFSSLKVFLSYFESRCKQSNQTLPISFVTI